MYVLLTTTGAALPREMLSSIPIPTSAATSEDPPYEMNGSGCPVSGKSCVTTPIFTNAWNASQKVIPAASTRPKSSGALDEMRKPR